MKKIMLAICGICICMVACKPAWNKERAFKVCSESLQKTYDINKFENKKAIDKLCNCISDKMMTKYKTEEDANKDVPGMIFISDDCKKEYVESSK